MVKCADCGFLAVRDRKSYLLIDAGDNYREVGAIPNRCDDKGMNPHKVHEQAPICFARSYDLKSEFNSQKTSSETAITVDILNKDRDCDKFTKWQQGFTPKEHREMLDRQLERKWRIITGIIFVILAGLFTLLGAFIANLE